MLGLINGGARSSICLNICRQATSEPLPSGDITGSHIRKQSNAGTTHWGKSPSRFRAVAMLTVQNQVCSHLSVVSLSNPNTNAGCVWAMSCNLIDLGVF